MLLYATCCSCFVTYFTYQPSLRKQLATSCVPLRLASHIYSYSYGHGQHFIFGYSCGHACYVNVEHEMGLAYPEIHVGTTTEDVVLDVTTTTVKMFVEMGNFIIVGMNTW